MKNSVARFFAGKTLALLVSVALIIFLSSCLDDDNNPVDPVPLGYVAIYHAAPDAPGLDIFVDDKQVNSQSFDYTDYSGYLNFFTGSRHLEFNAINAANALVDTTFDVAEGKAYSLFLINTLAGGMEALVVADSAATPATGKAMVRFVHLSPDAAAVDIAEKDSSGAPLFSNASFRQATDFKEVDAKTYSFEVKTAGSDDVLLTADDIDIKAGGYYTIVTRGFATPPAGNTNVLSVEVLF